MAYELNTYLDDRILAQKTVPHTKEDAERIEAYLRWTKESHFQKSMDKGERVPEEFFPKAARFSKGKMLCDYQDVAGFLAVSTRFKDLVESFEPGVHQFVPVEVLHKDGSPYATYWYFIICTLIDAINPVTGGVKQVWLVPESRRAELPDAYMWDLNWGSEKPPAVFADEVARRAAWRDKRFSVPPFHSDAFVDGLRAQAMIGFQLVRHWQEI
jgi:hypothetical protein